MSDEIFGHINRDDVNNSRHYISKAAQIDNRFRFAGRLSFLIDMKSQVVYRQSFNEFDFYGSRKKHGHDITYRELIFVMQLNKLLSQRKADVVKRWFDEVVNTYPGETAQFLKRQKNQFANPVGNTTHNGLDALFDVLLHGGDPEAINSFLDPIIRIRALQNFTPSQATSFILFLKKIVKEIFEKEITDPHMMEDFLDFASRVDDLCLMAFDIYSKCRETLYQIQANEMRNRTFRAFEKAGLVRDDPEEDSPYLRPVKPSVSGDSSL